MRKILIASGNQGKTREILSALLPLQGFDVLTVTDIGGALEIEETGKTHAENALIKAKAYFEKTSIPTIAEDSGMEVEALEGELGISTRRWGAGEKANDETWLAHFMKKMAGEKNRKARFVCHAVYLDENGPQHFEGECLGMITEAIEGPVLPGIPLSAVFKPIGHDLVYSAMTETEKNKLSHRGKAIQQLRTWLLKKSSTITVFTGGGTTGHVTKNLIVMEALKKSCPDAVFYYIGSAQGKEAELVTKEVAEFHAVPTGKLRRYFSLQTIPDFFRFIAGIWKAYRKLTKISEEASEKVFFESFRRRAESRPERSEWRLEASVRRGGRVAYPSRQKTFSEASKLLVFSSGGYVALPVCIAAWLRGIPIITHETDSVPGLSNRIIGKLAKKVLLGFEAAAPYFNPTKVVVTGNPVSSKLFTGSREWALQKLGFSAEKPVLLLMGGSQGAKEINELVWQILPELVKDWQVIHVTGKNKGRNLTNVRNVRNLRKNTNTNSYSPYHPYDPYNPSSYRFFDYLTDDYPDFLTAADLVISRAGGNTLAEVAALQKPAIIIPLMSSAADHQRKGAIEMRRHNPSWTVLEQPNAEELLAVIQKKGIRTHSASLEMTERATQKIIEILL